MKDILILTTVSNPIGIQEFKDEKFRGRFLQVSVARENFLEKLKREREEAALNKPISVATASAASTSQPAAALPTLKPAKLSKSSSSGSDDSSSDDEPEPKKTVVTAVKSVNGMKKPASSSSSSSSSASESSDEEPDLILRKKSKAFLENGRVN